MAFCKSCGQEIGEASFCPKCGASQSVVAAAAPAGGGAAPAAAAASPTAGMEENVAGLLCYLFGWVSGLIFLLIDKRPFVKFHAAQSIALSISFFVVWIVFWVATLILGFITAAILHFPLGFLMAFLFPVIIIAFFIAFIFCMYKAYNREEFKLPIIGNLVEGMVK
jgi:uncharacterized membrane protein